MFNGTIAKQGVNETLAAVFFGSVEEAIIKEQ